MKISWTPPTPRSGLAGAWDKFIGPGATNVFLKLLVAHLLPEAPFRPEAE